MNKRRKNLLSELEKIASHFRLTLTKIEIIRKTALALDAVNKKLVLVDERDKPFFRTIDLHKVRTCSIKLDYRSINAGDANAENIDDFIEKIELSISHVDPAKSVRIPFYDKRENNAPELRQLIEKAKSWRDNITSMRQPDLKVRA